MSRKEEKLISRRVYVANPGNVWNPLLGYPRNDECFCHSGIKAKKCCLPDVVEFVTEKQAREIKDALANGQAIELGDADETREKQDAAVRELMR